MGLTDEEFRAKLEKHFSLYRINLRSPIASRVIPHKWYRVDLLLVNELGLFRRADIEPDGQIQLDCHLYHSMGETGITPLALTDDEWEIQIRAAPGYQQGELATERYPMPGFYGTGKGTFEYCVVPKHDKAVTMTAKRYLYILPKSLHQFPKIVANDNEPYRMENILPLMVGPIEIDPHFQLEEAIDTSKPLELWNKSDIEMVYDGYRVFSSSAEPPFVNIAIHEMWDSGIPGKIWDSALVTLDVVKGIIKHHPEYINGRHVLDLSAGTGLLGLYIASMFHSSHSAINNGTVTITELDEALALINQNVEINQYLKTTDSCKLKTRSLVWGNAEEAVTCGKVDLIIASDVLYESQFFEDLVKTFVDLSTKDTRIYIGYKRRGFDEAEEKRFWSMCGEYYSVKLLDYNGEEDRDDCLVPHTALGTSVQLYRLLPLQDKFT